MHARDQHPSAAAVSAVVDFEFLESRLFLRVEGVDVSLFQGAINWQTLRANNKEFAFVRSSRTTLDLDPNFHTNMAGAKAAGVITGPYHRALPLGDGDAGAYTDPVTDARRFYNAAKDYIKEGYLRPVLDAEDGHTLGKAALVQWWKDFIAEFERLSGVEPIIYANTNYATNFIDAELAAEHDLWLARWNGGNANLVNPQTDQPETPGGYPNPYGQWNVRSAAPPRRTASGTSGSTRATATASPWASAARGSTWTCSTATWRRCGATSSSATSGTTTTRPSPSARASSRRSTPRTTTWAGRATRSTTPRRTATPAALTATTPRTAASTSSASTTRRTCSASPTPARASGSSTRSTWRRRGITRSTSGCRRRIRTAACVSPSTARQRRALRCPTPTTSASSRRAAARSGCRRGSTLRLTFDRAAANGAVAGVDWLKLSYAGALTATSQVATYVRNGSFANQNFGNDEQVLVKRSANLGSTREGYIKFDLRTLTTINSAKLRLTGRLASTSNASVVTNVYSAANTSWSESSLTWNSKPAAGPALRGSFAVTGTAYKTYEIDVTSFLQSEFAAGRKVVTLVLKNPNVSEPWTIFASDDSTAPPLLVLA